MTLSVPNRPAIVFDPPSRSSRAPGSTTPQVNRPKAWATHADAITNPITSQARSRAAVMRGAFTAAP